MNLQEFQRQQLQRRQFLKMASVAASSGIGLGTLASLNAAAQSATDYKALVCLFMFGGNDGNNMVVPTDATPYAQYRALRTNLALDQAALLPITPTNTGGALYGLHPAMPGLQNLFTQGQAAIIANVGPLAVPTTKAQWNARSVPLPDNLFSHSDQQAQWQSAIVDAPPRSGWGGRMMERQLAAGQVNRGYGVLSVAGGNVWETGDSTLAAYKVSSSGNFGFSFYNAAGADPLSLAITQTLAEPRAHLLDTAWTDVVARSIEKPARAHLGLERFHVDHCVSQHRPGPPAADDRPPRRRAHATGPATPMFLLLGWRFRHPWRRPASAAKRTAG